MANIQEAIDELAAEVRQNSDQVAAAVTLLNQLSSQIEENADDPAQVRALAQQLRERNNELAQAIVENTPAAPSQA